MREGVGQRGAGHADAQDPRRDLRHHLGREAERLRIERGVALGLGLERVELGGQVAVHAVRLDQRHRGLDGLQQRLVGRAGRRRGGRGGGVSRSTAAVAAGAGGCGASPSSAARSWKTAS